MKFWNWGMGKSLLALAASLLAGVSLHGAAGRAMTIGDLITTVRVSEPQMSPDGGNPTLVAFTRTTTDPTTGVRNADIWGVRVGQSPPYPLASSPKSDSTPRFTRDGQQLVFISSRGGSPQVYVANLFGPASTLPYADANGSGVVRSIGGQEAHAITNLAQGVQPPLVVSPDGKSIAVVSDVYPDCKDDACNRARMEAADKDPVKARLLTGLLYRHWDEWRLGLRHHVFSVPLAGGPAVDVTPGDFDSPPFQDEDGAVSFAPDGKELAVVSNREGGDREAFTTNKDVWIVPVTGGPARKFTTNPAADTHPVWSPDGKSIALLAQRRAGFESDRFYLELYDRASGQHHTVFETPDLSVSDFAFAKDGTSIFFTAASNGLDNLYAVSLPTGTPKLISKGGSISQIQVGKDQIVFAKSSLTSPADLFRVNLDGSGLKALTDENASWKKDVAFETPETMTVPGAGGTPIQYWLIKPPNFDASKKYPVVFLIHGGPQGEWGDGWSSRWNPSLWAAQGWVVAAPNPRGSTGFGQQFVDEISQDWGGRVMTDLNAVFDAVTKLPYVDANRQGIAGASYGGYAVDWILGHTTRFKAAVTHDGVFNLESMSLATEELWFGDWEFGGAPWTPAARANFAKWSPHLFAQNIKTPTLIITNEQDFRVPVDQGLQMFTMLRRNNVPSEVLTFPDEGHWVLKALNSQRWHDTVFAWMKKYL